MEDKSSKVENYGSIASLIFKQKKEEDLLDNINVLYVALTRAEEQLFVISGLVSENKDGKLPNNMAAFFVEFLGSEFNEEQLEYEFGSNQKNSITKEVVSNALTIPQLSTTLNPKNIKIAQRESVMWNTKQQSAIAYGNNIHEILSFVRTAEDVDLALVKAVESGLIVSNQMPEVAATVKSIVQHANLQDFFAADSKVLNEQTIIQKVGGIVKPDRMVLKKANQIYLLDYKTGSHLPKHQKQLEQYQVAIEEMGYQVVKKALVYIGESIEIVNL